MSSSDLMVKAKQTKRSESEHVTFTIPIAAILEAFIPAEELAKLAGCRIDAWSSHSRDDMDGDAPEDVLEIGFVRTTDYKADESGTLVRLPKPRRDYPPSRATVEKMIDEKLAAVVKP